MKANLATREPEMLKMCDQHFDAISNWLKKPEWPNSIRSVAILYSPKDFAFQHRHEREEGEKHGEQRENIDETRRDLDHPIRSAR